MDHCLVLKVVFVVVKDVVRNMVDGRKKETFLSPLSPNTVNDRRPIKQTEELVR